MRTGDLGYLDGTGAVVITGRLKDLIIVRGQNYYPQDLEKASIASDSKLRPTCAAFLDPQHVDHVVLVQEMHADPALLEPGERKSLENSIRENVLVSCGVRVTAVCLVAAKTLPKTSSGKIRRREAASQFNGFRQKQEALLESAESLTASESPLTLAALAKAIAVVSDADEREFDPDMSPASCGLDSLAIAEVRNQLLLNCGAAPPLEAMMVARRVRDFIAAEGTPEQPAKTLVNAPRQVGAHSGVNLAFAGAGARVRVVQFASVF